VREENRHLLKETSGLKEKISGLEERLAASEELAESYTAQKSQLEELQEVLSGKDDELALLREQIEIFEHTDMSLRGEEIETAEVDMEESTEIALSDDDLIADIKEPQIPKMEAILRILESAIPRDESDGDETGSEGTSEDKDSAKDSYNVFLPKLTTDDKKEKAIPLIEEITGLSNKEAVKLAARIVIPIAKGIDRDKADAIKDRFMEIGILPRIKKQV
jgi:ribosomal protein L7/L12